MSMCVYARVMLCTHMYVHFEYELDLQSIIFYLRSVFELHAFRVKCSVKLSNHQQHSVKCLLRYKMLFPANAAKYYVMRRGKKKIIILICFSLDRLDSRGLFGVCAPSLFASYHVCLARYGVRMHLKWKFLLDGGEASRFFGLRVSLPFFISFEISFRSCSSQCESPRVE